MSDRLSPENLGKNLYIAYATRTRGIIAKVAISEWNDECTSEEKKDWLATAQEFCKYLKEAEKDS